MRIRRIIERLFEVNEEAFAEEFEPIVAGKGKGRVCLTPYRYGVPVTLADGLVYTLTVSLTRPVREKEDADIPRVEPTPARGESIVLFPKKKQSGKVRHLTPKEAKERGNRVVETGEEESEE